ncbi:hypothetical protein [Persicobacter sp. CCB-QB2]|uniref:hypothetical protein n=1 Tax=Persicobacter sp. CCB-QB2 TaxID=1561025 RepID=UPI0006A9D7C4|nr:hypothetical protein [Persicobacter sp. CCB-QB2]
MSNVNPLTIDLSKAYRVVVKEGDDYKNENSLFLNLYQRAEHHVQEILSQNLKASNSDNLSNNVIAFCGDRGTGKSSVMVSVKNALCKDYYIRESFSVNSNKGSIGFTGLPTIDPTMMEDNDDLIKVVLAYMFAEFETQLKENPGLKQSLKRELLKEFEEVFQILQAIHKGSIMDGECLEALSLLASGTKLRERFEKLVKKYLEFVEKQVLVISIDDFDLNITKAYDMAEQLRKYLNCSNVIVLMAVKIEQMHEAVEQAFWVQLKNKSQISKTEELVDKPSEMADKFIQKLIPIDRRILMPEMGGYSNDEEFKLKLVFGEKTVFSSGDQSHTLETALLRLIYDTTGLIFLIPEYGLHYLVPSNLRGYVNLMSMLWHMKPKENQLLTSTQKLQNLNLFEEYLLNDWLKGLNDLKLSEIAHEFCLAQDEIKNRFIIDSLFRYFSKKVDVKAIEDCLPSSYGNGDPRNVSFGDVSHFLSNLTKIRSLEGIVKFKFLIKSLYTVSVNKIVLDSGGLKEKRIRLLLKNLIYSEDNRLIRSSQEGESRIYFKNIGKLGVSDDFILHYGVWSSKSIFFNSSIIEKSSKSNVKKFTYDFFYPSISKIKIIDSKICSILPFQSMQLLNAFFDNVVKEKEKKGFSEDEKNYSSYHDNALKAMGTISKSNEFLSDEINEIRNGMVEFWEEHYQNSLSVFSEVNSPVPLREKIEGRLNYIEEDIPKSVNANRNTWMNFFEKLIIPFGDDKIDSWLSENKNKLSVKGSFNKTFRLYVSEFKKVLEGRAFDLDLGLDLDLDSN